MASDRTLTIPLDPPLEYAGGKIAELKLREPTGAEMRAAESKLSDGITVEAESAFEAALLGAVSGLDEKALNLLPVSIMRQARRFVSGFDLGSGAAVSEPEATLELDLDEPISANGVSYASIRLREPTVGMRRRAETALRTGNNTANRRHYQLILVAEASGVPFAAIERFPVSVLNDAEAYLLGFIAPGPKRGTD